ncbi:ABC transporter substrate-binding protein [Siminovitchia fortis]|uniref:ABC transporter substrate-binding protein n=1 Tax=Siminovitchia fortis TaxID=254758 RepID=UPI0011AA2860|nr:ABC transporter substrate-binding protein [Siminovitchia fortis]
MNQFTKLLLPILLLLFLTACNTDTANNDDENSTNQPSEQAKQSAYPLTVTDGRGKEITITEKPKRIVSTALAVDELLVDLVPSENLVGVTAISSDPAISNVAGKTDSIETKFETVTAEQILALKPDLVIIPSYVNPDVLNQLENAGITTFQVIDDTSFEGILKTVETLGKIVGEQEKANNLIADIQKRIDALKEKADKKENKPRVLYYTEYSSSVTDNTTIGEMIKLAGGINVVSEAGILGESYPDYPEISKEVLVQLKPDVIFTTAWGSTTNNGEPAFVTEWKKDPALKDVPAIKNNKIYVLDSANVTTASHYVIEGAEEMAAILSKE